MDVKLNLSPETHVFLKLLSTFLLYQLSELTYLKSDWSSFDRNQIINLVTEHFNQSLTYRLQSASYITKLLGHTKSQIHLYKC